jgi:DNA-binding XRE family transcriptional regulator
MTGFSEQTVINWEKGTYKPSEHGIRALEKAFGQQLRK